MTVTFRRFGGLPQEELTEVTHIKFAVGTLFIYQKWRCTQIQVSMIEQMEIIEDGYQWTVP